MCTREGGEQAFVLEDILKSQWPSDFSLYILYIKALGRVHFKKCAWRTRFISTLPTLMRRITASASVSER